MTIQVIRLQIPSAKMSRCVLLSVLLAVVLAKSDPTVPTDFEPSTVIVDVNSVAKDATRWENIFKMESASEEKDARTAKPEIMELFSSSQITAVPAAQVGDVIRYTIGRRVQNDRLVGHGAGGKRWTVPQDVTLALKYPNSGQGAIVTYVEIVVNQSSNIGRATVIAGGIGQRFLTTVVEAKNTLWFSYTADIYGL